MMESCERVLKQCLNLYTVSCNYTFNQEKIDLIIYFSINFKRGFETAQNFTEMKNKNKNQEINH